MVPVFFEANANDSSDRAHLDVKQFETCLARMVDASVSACVDSSLPQGVMDLLALLEASHCDQYDDYEQSRPSTQAIYSWEKVYLLVHGSCVL